MSVRVAFECRVTMSCRILLVSGSLRSNSTNRAVLRTAQVGARDVTTVLYDELAHLPHFNPDDDADPLPVAAAALREQVRDADTLLFSTPEYAGGLPGSFKNLLDWSIGDAQAGSIYEKPVAWNWHRSHTAPRLAARVAADGARLCPRRDCRSGLRGRP